MFFTLFNPAIYFRRNHAFLFSRAPLCRNVTSLRDARRDILPMSGVSHERARKFVRPKSEPSLCFGCKLLFFCIFLYFWSSITRATFQLPTNEGARAGRCLLEVLSRRCCCLFLTRIKSTHTKKKKIQKFDTTQLQFLEKLIWERFPAMCSVCRGGLWVFWDTQLVPLMTVDGI